VFQNPLIVAPKRLICTMAEYMGKLHALLRAPSKRITDIPFLVDDSSTLISQRPSWPKDVISVTIVTNLAIELTGVMPYMVVLLDQLRLPKLFICKPSTMDPTSSDISGQATIFN